MLGLGGALGVMLASVGATNAAGATHFSTANDVAIQSDGKIVAVGGGPGHVFALARYRPSGALDRSFGGDGRVTTNVPGAEEEAEAVAIQSDGKIVAAGRAGLSHKLFALARYRPSGALDRSFGGDGIVLTDFTRARFEGAMAVAIQSDGKIVAAGFAGNKFGVARYLPHGGLDRTFGGNGKVTKDVELGGDAAYGVAVQADGRIVAAGTSGTPATPSFALVRYRPNGRLDDTFGGDGVVTTSFGSGQGYDVAAQVAIQADGRIVAAGTHFPNSNPSRFAVARYRRGGSLDGSFSGDGRVTTEFGFKGTEGADMAIQPDGRIVIVGAYGPRFALARYMASGSLDRSFGGDGRVTTGFGTHASADQANGVAVQADGRIVAAGTEADQRFALARYKPNGALDRSFAGDGKVTTAFP